MKRLLLPLVALAAAGSLQAQSVVGTMHDLSLNTNAVYATTSVAGKGVQICAFCHAPHVRAGAKFGNGYIMRVPLWSHGDSTLNNEAVGFASYYTSPTGTLQGTITANNGAPSIACLSCHDGSISVGQGISSPMGVYVAGVGSTPYTWNGADQNAGVLTKHLWGTAAGTANSLAMMHPVGITYTNITNSATLTNSQLVASGSVVNAKLFPVGGALTVQCGSCHDPHDDTKGAFLRDTTTGSALCLDCHNK